MLNIELIDQLDYHWRQNKDMYCHDYKENMAEILAEIPELVAAWNALVVHQAAITCILEKARERVEVGDIFRHRY